MIRYTVCPECESIFRCAPEVLAVADGRVRCGRCRHLFQAQRLSFDTLEAAEAAVAGGIVAAADLTVDEDTLLIQRDVEVDAAETLDEGDIERLSRSLQADERIGPNERAGSTDTAEGADTAPLVPIAPDEAPGLYEQIAQARPEPSFTAGHLLLAGVLALLLAGQLVHAFRGPLAANDGLRPLVQGFCQALRCELPPQRLPGSIELVERSVRTHPRVARALVIDATFANRAAVTQPYPLLEVRLSDLSGARVAGRRFRPREYLPQGTNIAGGMAPGETVSAHIEVVEPSIPVVSFQFAFF